MDIITDLIIRLKRSPLLELIEFIQEKIWLLRAMRKNVFSQHGEDQFILTYFNNKKNGLYIDVGANHPFKISNTYLLYRNGWTGVTIEPIPHLYRKHKKFRPRDINLNCGIGEKRERIKFFELIPRVLSSFDETICNELIESGQANLRKTYEINIVTLDDVYNKYLKTRNVDVLSIDTEGYDFQVLKSIDWKKWSPSVIVCETKDVIGDSRESMIDDFLITRSYRKIKTFVCNGIYIKKERLIAEQKNTV
jgi:FkbM family methyltransferase